MKAATASCLSLHLSLTREVRHALSEVEGSPEHREGG